MKVGGGEMGSGQREDVTPPGGFSHIPPLHLLPTQWLPPEKNPLPDSHWEVWPSHREDGDAGEGSRPRRLSRRDRESAPANGQGQQERAPAANLVPTLPSCVIWGTRLHLSEPVVGGRGKYRASL